jgi:hypothetical protein
MAARTITLAKQIRSDSTLPELASWKGDGVVLVLDNLTPSASYTVTVTIKPGDITQDLTAVTNVLPAFGDTGNLTQTVVASASGQGSITISTAQSAALAIKTNYVLEIQTNDGLVTETYGQYNIYIEQELATNAVPGPQYSYTDAKVLSPLGSGSVLDYNSSFIFTKTISSQQTITVLNPVAGQMVLLQTTNAVANIAAPILPAESILYSDNWDTAINAVNLVCILCVNKTTPSYIVTENAKMN